MKVSVPKLQSFPKSEGFLTYWSLWSLSSIGVIAPSSGIIYPGDETFLYRYLGTCSRFWIGSGWSLL